MKLLRSPQSSSRLLPVLITVAFVMPAGDSLAQTVPQPSVARRWTPELHRRVVAGDFTGDGIIDLAGNNGEEGSGRINLAVGRGDGTFSLRSTNVLSDALGAGDFNGDGHLDLLTRWLPAPDEEISIWPGMGDGTFGARVRIGNYFEEVATVIADFDADGNLDVAITAHGDPNTGVAILLGNGDLTFARTFVEVGEGRGVAAGDVNGDARPDLGVRLARSVVVLINSGDGRLYTRTDLAFDRELAGLGMADLDADGRADLVVSGGTEGDGIVWVHRGRSDGTFEAATRYAARGAGAITFGDLNRDGRPDVVGAGGRFVFHDDCAPGLKGTLWVSVLPGRGDGTLARGSAFAVSSRSTAGGLRGSLVSVAIADLNRDGHDDIVGGGGSVLVSRPPDPNWGPVVNAGPDATIDGGRIRLAASASDVDSDALTYTWTHSGGIAVPSIPNPCVQVGSGTHTFTVAVDDGHGHTATDSVTYTVPGTTGPITIELTAPVNGEDVPAGVPYTVRWTADADPEDTFRVSVFDGTDWTVVCQGIPADRSCVWDDPQPVVDNAQLTVIGVDRDDQVLGRASSTFRIVASSDPGALPAGWSNRDIGNVAAAGAATYDEATGTFTVSGSGADIWGSADEFHFVSRQWIERPAAFELTARVTSIENVHRWTKVGLMVREHGGAGAVHASAFVTPTTEKGIAFQRRPVEDGASEHTPGRTISAPVWLRLVVLGNRVEAYSRRLTTDRWVLIGIDELTRTRDTLEIGLAVGSHVDGTLATATFDNVSVVRRGFWRGLNIGDVGTPGFLTFQWSTIGVHGSGADIWGTGDAFFFAYQDGGQPHMRVTSRVLSLEHTHQWAKAGVMIRGNLGAGAQHVMVVASAGRGVAMQYRNRPGNVSSSFTPVPGGAPVWVRLTRSGDLFVGELSTDGLTWREIGRVTVPMSVEAPAGLAVTSHEKGTVASAEFDDVAIEFLQVP